MAKSSLFCRLLLCCVALAASARSEEKRPPQSGSLPELLQTMRAADTGRGRFELELPLIGKPLLVTWQVGPAPTYETLNWPTYSWESLLAHRGVLSLVGFNRVMPAGELACLATTCVPIPEKTLGMDLRLGLGGRGILPDSYLFLRRETVRSPVRNSARVKVGIAGVLDL